MIYAFEGHELDEERFELRRGDEPIHAQPKVLDLLFLLVKTRDRVLTKSEIFAAVWPGVVVSDTSLARTVLGARRAIGDDADEPRFIVTVRGRGVRFAAPVTERARPSRAPAAEIRASSLPPPRLVGREDSVLVQMESHLEAAMAGRGGVILLAGEPGMGKTRTLQELVAMAKARGASAVSVRCPSTPGAPPCWVWTEVLRALGDAPEVRADASEFARFDALARALVLRAQASPLVLAIDDAHRADDPSLAFLEFFTRTIPEVPVLVALTYRDTTDTARPALGALLGAYGCHTTTLRPLGLAECTELIEALLGRPAPPELARKIHEKSGGTPRLVRQLLDTEWARASLAAPLAHVASSVDLAPGLLQSTVRLLDDVSPACRDVLGTAAVLGRTFDVATLARAASLEPPRLLELIEEALSARVLERRGPLAYAFTYTIFRDVLYKRLSEPERARRHGASGVALLDHYRGREDAHALELAHHFVRAAAVGYAERACALAARAAELAAARGAHAEAAVLYEQALSAMAFFPAEGERRDELLAALDRARLRLTAGRS